MAVFENIPVEPSADNYLSTDKLFDLVQMQMFNEYYDDVIFLLESIPTHPKSMWLRAVILMDDSIVLEETPDEGRLQSAESLLLQLADREERNPAIHTALTDLYLKLNRRLCSYAHEFKAALLEDQGAERLPAIEKKISQLSPNQLQDVEGARLIGHCYKESGNHPAAARFFCLAAEYSDLGIVQLEAAKAIEPYDSNRAQALYQRANELGCPNILSRC